MAGLNFYTQTLINVNEDNDSKVKAPMFKGITSGTDGDKCLHIKRDFNFYKDKPGVGKVLRVTKAVAADAELAQAEIKISGALETAIKAPTVAEGGPKRVFCRLDIYVGVEGAEPYIYSNPWVQKGIPFWIEFTVNKNDSSKVICQNIVKSIKDNHLFLCDKDLIEVKVNSDSTGIVLDATSEYQRFRKITISTFDETQDDAEVLAELDTDISHSSPIQLKKRGKEGFGTYSHIIKDLRLPTAANTQWTHIRQAETPILGAKYDEFIIEYEAPATNDGLGAVGQKLSSVTTHVFWINTTISGQFSSALTTAGLSDSYVASQASIVASLEARLEKIEEAQKGTL